MTQSNMEVVAFLKETARYFANRDTGGEDRAHWANVYNSETCLKAAEALSSAQSELERLREELGRLELSRGAASKVALDNIARAEAAEKERDALREALALAEEVARDITANPAGSLWNYGTKPSRLDEAKWQGSREAAEDILAALQPLEPKND